MEPRIDGLGVLGVAQRTPLHRHGGDGSVGLTHEKPARA
jgi:hypothetical protein